MGSMIASLTMARLAGTAGIAAQLAAAYVFLLIPGLAVPTPANYVFFAAWFVLVGLTIAWWRHHPWRSFLVPIVSVPVALLVIEMGTRALDWAP